jgi:hypothetical protein
MKDLQRQVETRVRQVKTKQSELSDSVPGTTSGTGIFFSPTFDYHYICIGSSIPSDWHAIGKASGTNKDLGVDIQKRCPRGVYWVKRDK